MKALTKLAVVVLVSGLFGLAIVEWAFQAGESVRETVDRHAALRGDE